MKRKPTRIIPSPDGWGFVVHPEDRVHRRPSPRTVEDVAALHIVEPEPEPLHIINSVEVPK